MKDRKSTIVVPRPADEVKKVEVSRSVAEAKEVDIPSQIVDVAKVEFLRSDVDVHVPNVEVVNGTNVIDQVISEEVLFDSEKVMMGVVDQLNGS
ncbi:hypothetical protein K7X08_036983 [Anisodus acutangulus]|uniref:Uncharacterized protein n=1 Tax=Anisodus acutangulus TaxID=402998 RepID=A0A9Q1LA02_9SOLA|nr:hypothetical protein K7X08_036983 [Anisodus acutangulus]